MPVKPPVRVILVTDGDAAAREAVEAAARNLGLRCISASGGNEPPPGEAELVRLIRTAARDPVLVMVDDHGDPGPGRGERTLAYLARHPDLRVLGAVAVASDQGRAAGVAVDCSVTSAGRVVAGAVDKDGRPRPGRVVKGDTVDVLRTLAVPVIVGLGDVGKQHGADGAAHGALTTRAILEVLARSGAAAPEPR